METTKQGSYYTLEATPEEKKNKKKAAISTAIIYSLLFILLLFVSMKPSQPESAPHGIEVMLGSESFGQSQVFDNPLPAEQVPSPPTQSSPSPADASEQDPVLTQNIEETAPVETRSQQQTETRTPVQQPNPTPPNQTREPQPEPERPQQQPNPDFAFRPGQGAQGENPNPTDTRPGNPLGTTGEPSGQPGMSQGDGMGVDFSLEGRRMMNRIVPEDDSQLRGLVVVEITVDREGNVVRARAGVRGTTLSNQAIHRKCEEAALRQKFTPKPDAPFEQVGTITYNFNLR